MPCNWQSCKYSDNKIYAFLHSSLAAIVGYEIACSFQLAVNKNSNKTQAFMQLSQIIRQAICICLKQTRLGFLVDEWQNMKNWRIFGGFGWYIDGSYDRIDAVCPLK